MQVAAVAANHNTFRFILDACLAVGTSDKPTKDRQALRWGLTIVENMCDLHVLPPLVTVNQLLKSFLLEDQVRLRLFPPCCTRVSGLGLKRGFVLGPTEP